MSGAGMAIRGVGLTKRYGDLLAVDRLDLEVRPGELLGFLGPNGAGKTTSIRMLTGTLRPSLGKVYIGDDEITSHSDRVRTRVGVCPQDLVIWERLTCVENLSLMGRLYGIPKRAAVRRAEELLSCVGLSGRAGVRAARLSGGMKKRLNLLMALVHDPEVVVLDEPITGLDPQSRLLVGDYIRDLCRQQGKTVILTTHLMEVAARLSDRIAIIDHGRIRALDTLANLKRSSGEGDVVELSVASAANGDASIQEQAVEAIRGISGVLDLTVHEECIRFRARDAISLLPELSRRIDGLGGRISGLSLRDNSLEEIFISLTGSELRD